MIKILVMKRRFFYILFFIILICSCTSKKKYPEIFISFPSTELKINDTSYKIDKCYIIVTKKEENLFYISKKNNNYRLILNDIDFQGKHFYYDSLKTLKNNNSTISFYVTLKKENDRLYYQNWISIDSLKDNTILKLKQIIE